MGFGVWATDGAGYKAFASHPGKDAFVQTWLLSTSRALCLGNKH